MRTTMEPEFENLGPENPKYKPSAKQAALDKIVAERKQRLLAANEDPPPQVIKDARPPGVAIGDELAKLGFPVVSSAELEFAEEIARAEHERKLAEMKTRRRRARYERFFGPRYREPWDWGKIAPAVSRDEVRKVFEWQFGPEGLYIYGATGHSKTRALAVLMRRLIIDEERWVLVLDGPRFSIAAGKAFSDPSRTEEWLDELCRVDTLAIDDMGKRWTPATEDAAYTIVERRTAAMRPTIVTVNYTGDDLQRMSNLRNELAAVRDITTPLRRRLQDYCASVIF